MKEKKHKVWQVLKKAAEFEADMKDVGWPPECGSILYQPKKPQRKKS